MDGEYDDPWADEASHADSATDSQSSRPLESRKDALIFVIDACELMRKALPLHGTSQESASPLVTALRCALRVMRRKIHTSDRDATAIILYGCRETKNFSNFANVCVRGSAVNAKAPSSCFTLLLSLPLLRVGVATNCSRSRRPPPHESLRSRRLLVALLGAMTTSQVHTRKILVRTSAYRAYHAL